MIRQTPKWLYDAVLYQVYPQSFFDSNGDGIGDLPGITAKLDYIQSLGVSGIWINPFFESPFNDAGYDIADYYGVAPRYGTIADFHHLIQEAHARNIRVLFDLVIDTARGITPGLSNPACKHLIHIPTGLSGQIVFGHQHLPALRLLGDMLRAWVGI